MVNLADLKKRSSKDLNRWKQKIAEATEKGRESNRDERFWFLGKDEKGNGEAIIRFLPVSPQDLEKDPELFPFVEVKYRNFQGPSGMYYNETCRTTIKESDPVQDDISSMINGNWDAAPGEVKAIYRARKAKSSFLANILVLKDPANPENEGKVFLFRAGKTIMDKINLAMFPSQEGLAPKKPINVVDFWSGANFYMKTKIVDGYQNYDESHFFEPGPIFEKDNDKNVEKIWKQQYSLLDFVDPKNIKSYEELEKRYRDVLTVRKGVSTTAETTAARVTVTSKSPEAKVESVVSLSEDESSDDSSDELIQGIEQEIVSDDTDALIENLFSND